MDFLMCVLQYVIIMVILIGIGLLGGFCGIKLRKRKDAKGTAAKEESAK